MYKIEWAKKEMNLHIYTAFHMKITHFPFARYGFAIRNA